MKKTVCDICGNDEGVLTYPAIGFKGLDIGIGEDFNLDLCIDCKKEIIEQLKPIIKKLSTKKIWEHKVRERKKRMRRLRIKRRGRNEL